MYINKHKLENKSDQWVLDVLACLQINCRVHHLACIPCIAVLGGTTRDVFIEELSIIC